MSILDFRLSSCFLLPPQINNRMINAREPILVKIAPGIIIPSLSSPVDVDPMMRSGKPGIIKNIPIPNAIFAAFLVDSSVI